MNRSISLSAQNSHALKTRSPQHSPSSQADKASSPLKYLLHNNIKLNVGLERERNEEEIEIISHLLRECPVF
jgi:predicted SprT family Zn-dependent metalloprotease